jgi:hypothetical protein
MLRHHQSAATCTSGKFKQNSARFLFRKVAWVGCSDRRPSRRTVQRLLGAMLTVRPRPPVDIFICMQPGRDTRNEDIFELLVPPHPSREMLRLVLRLPLQLRVSGRFTRTFI